VLTIDGGRNEYMLVGYRRDRGRRGWHREFDGRRDGGQLPTLDLQGRSVPTT
jgi:hypothetical protein